MTAFEQAFSIVIGSEGGFDANAVDPGNWTKGRVGEGELKGTNYGISAAAYPDLDIEHLTLAAAQDLYRRDYWGRVVGDSLSPPLALVLFDAAVNNGVGQAARWLQGVVGTTIDGVIGEETLAALHAMVAQKGGAAVCAEFMAQRLAFMAGLPSWPIFGLGWARRLCALPFQSLTMGTM